MAAINIHRNVSLAAIWRLNGVICNNGNESRCNGCIYRNISYKWHHMAAGVANGHVASANVNGVSAYHPWYNGNQLSSI